MIRSGVTTAATLGEVELNQLWKRVAIARVALTPLLACILFISNPGLAANPELRLRVFLTYLEPPRLVNPFS